MKLEVYDGETYGATSVRLREHMSSAFFYYACIDQLAELDLHLDVYIDEDLSSLVLDRYSEYMHKEIFPGGAPENVREIAIDGHEKVLTKCPGRAAATRSHNKTKTPMKAMRSRRLRRMMKAMKRVMMKKKRAGRPRHLPSDLSHAPRGRAVVATKGGSGNSKMIC